MTRRSEASAPKVALLTGGSGFLGGYVLEHLLERDYHVIALLRKRIIYGRKPGKVKRVIPASARVEVLAEKFGLDAEAKRRLHVVEGDLASMDPARVEGEIRRILRDEIVHHTIEIAINCAGRLTMDYEGQDPEQRAAIQKRNHETNVGGVARLLETFERLERPAGAPHPRPAPDLPLIRIIRPSIIAGRASSDALMAFLRYGETGYGPLNLSNLGRALARLLPADIVIPFPGNPKGIADIIDVEDVVDVLKILIRRDVQEVRGRIPTIEGGISLGILHQVSTCYVHGERTGRLTETPLPPREEVRPKNSYEATKAQAERMLEEWSQKRWDEMRQHPGLAAGASDATGRPAIRYNQIANPQAYNFQDNLRETLRALDWPESTLEKFRLFPPGPRYDEALAKLRRGAPLGSKVLDGIWKRLPMLETYMFRADRTSFSVDNTCRLLDEEGRRYEPKRPTAAWVRESLLGRAPRRR